MRHHVGHSSVAAASRLVPDGVAFHQHSGRPGHQHVPLPPGAQTSRLNRELSKTRCPTSRCSSRTPLAPLGWPCRDAAGWRPRLLAAVVRLGATSAFAAERQVVGRTAGNPSGPKMSTRSMTWRHLGGFCVFLAAACSGDRHRTSRDDQMTPAGSVVDEEPSGSPDATNPNHNVQGGLEISVVAFRQNLSANQPLLVTVALRNVSDHPLVVLSHVQLRPSGVNLDWYHFRLKYLAPDKNGRCDFVHARRLAQRVEIIEGRMKSEPVARSLAAGERITHTVDLQEWAIKSQGARIPPGHYAIGVTYTVKASSGLRPSRWPWDDPHDELWTGSVDAVSLLLTITGPIPEDRCSIGPEPAQDHAIENAAQPGIAAVRASPGR